MILWFQDICRYTGLTHSFDGRIHPTNEWADHGTQMSFEQVYWSSVLLQPYLDYQYCPSRLFSALILLHCYAVSNTFFCLLRTILLFNKDSISSEYDREEYNRELISCSIDNPSVLALPLCLSSKFGTYWKSKTFLLIYSLGILFSLDRWRW